MPESRSRHAHTPAQQLQKTIGCQQNSNRLQCSPVALCNRPTAYLTEAYAHFARPAHFPFYGSPKLAPLLWTPGEESRRYPDIHSAHANFRGAINIG
jgi:hypothetical protein